MPPALGRSGLSPRPSTMGWGISLRKRYEDTSSCVVNRFGLRETSQFVVSDAWLRASNRWLFWSY